MGNRAGKWNGARRRLSAHASGLEGTRVNVATPAALYRLKQGTIRAKDHQDAAALRERFNLKNDRD